MTHHCAHCKHFGPLSASGLGECRRYPPSPLCVSILPHAITGEALRQRWPLVQAHDWCGEWEKEGETK